LACRAAASKYLTNLLITTELFPSFCACAELMRERRQTTVMIAHRLSTVHVSHVRCPRHLRPWVRRCVVHRR
jgi:hypothetical protein